MIDERRTHLCPIIEALCDEWQGFSKIPLMVAWDRLKYSLEWFRYLERIQPVIVDRVTDKTPIVATMHIPGGCYEMSKIVNEPKLAGLIETVYEFEDGPAPLHYEAWGHVDPLEER